MPKQEIKLLSSLFLFAVSVALIIFILIIPTSFWYVLLIFASLPISFLFVNLLDRILTSWKSDKYLPIIVGVLIFLSLISSYLFSKPPTSASYPLEHLYIGTSQVTEVQYNDIISYEAPKTDGYISLTSNDPITIEYRFHSLYDYTYLSQVDVYSYPNSIRQAYPNVIKIGLLFMPLLLIIIGFSYIRPLKPEVIS